MAGDKNNMRVAINTKRIKFKKKKKKKEKKTEAE